MIRAAILDDEVRGSKLLGQKLQHFKEELQILSVFDHPREALKKIASMSIDVLFLDIEMPEMNAFQFLEHLGEFDFEIIFTTAYDTYTIEALRLSAVDYLLKPVNEDELRQAIERLKKKLATKAAHHPSTPVSPLPDKPSPRNRISLPTAEGVHLITKTHILRIEAMSNYSAFILIDGKKIVVSKTLKEYDAILENDVFMRVNRSVIVNLDHVVKYKRGDGGSLELADGFEVEVSPQKKEELMTRLL
ncbi:MAG: response regulator transcription factor [Bacteroidetes bacterium]|nr:response regulator transcription factor [Bacteroidota bacterium]